VVWELPAFEQGLRGTTGASGEAIILIAMINLMVHRLEPD
jgi:hypothetical protein